MKHYFLSILLVVFFLSFSGGTQAQEPLADTVFHYNISDGVNGMLLTDNGEAILVGKMELDSLTPKNIWVKRLGFQGDTLVVEQWEKIFYPGTASRVSKVIWGQDSTVIIAGSWNNNSMLLKMSKEGDSLSMVLLPGTSGIYFKDVVELPNSDFVLLQADAGVNLYSKLLRMTSTGSVLWEQEFNELYYSSLVFYNADSVMTAGYEVHETYQHILMGSYAPVNGAQHYNNMYQENYGFNYSMEADSGAIYLGNSKAWLTSPSFVAQVIKMNPNGELEWELDFTGIGSTIIKDIEVYDNYLVTCSERVTAGQVIIGAITFDGVLAATYPIAKPIPEAVAVKTWQNYLYITGRQFNFSNGKDVFFMKYNLDSLFVITGQQEFIAAGKVSLYPNPSSDEVRIDLSGTPEDRLTSLHVYSITGKRELEMKVNSSIVTIPVRDLPEGLYVVMMHFENRPPLTKKIFVVH